MKRYQLTAFPACLTSEKQTKKSTWWRSVEEKLTTKRNSLLESERLLKEVKENVYRVVYMTSRSKLIYSVVHEQYRALTDSLNDFEEQCSELEVFIGQVVYHFHNKANLKRKRY